MFIGSFGLLGLLLFPVAGIAAAVYLTICLNRRRTDSAFGTGYEPGPSGQTSGQ